MGVSAEPASQSVSEPASQSVSQLANQSASQSVYPPPCCATFMPNLDCLAGSSQCPFGQADQEAASRGKADQPHSPGAGWGVPQGPGTPGPQLGRCRHHPC